VEEFFERYIFSWRRNTEN